MADDLSQRAREPKALYRCRTRVGALYIAPCRGGWQIQHGGASLGTTWPSAEAALAELLDAGTGRSIGGVDPSMLGIAPSLEDWERLGWVTGP